MIARLYFGVGITLFLSLGIFTAGCQSRRSRSTTPERASVAQTASVQQAPNEGRWSLRFARPCPESTFGTPAVTPLGVSGCGSAVFDPTSGEQVGVEPDRQSILAGVGPEGVLRQALGDDLVLVDLEGSVVWRFRVPIDSDFWLVSENGHWGVGVGYPESVIVNFAERTVRRAHFTCLDRELTAVSDDGVGVCVEPAREAREAAVVRRVDLTGRSEFEATPLAEELSPRAISPDGLTVAFLGEGKVTFQEVGGAILAEYPAFGDYAAFSPSGQRLVISAEERAPITVVSVADGVEAAFPPRFDGMGRFVSDSLLVVSMSAAQYWFHTGPSAASLPEPPARTMDGFTPLSPRVESDGTPVFVVQDGGVTNRDPTTVTGWAHDDAFVRVDVTDPVQFSRFTDDRDWALMVAGTFVANLGAESWARHGRDESDRRFVRGHYYVGGCERAHFDILVVDHGDVVEIVTLTSWGDEGDRAETVRAALGDEGHGAAMAIEAGDYLGDPSIGRLR